MENKAPAKKIFVVAIVVFVVVILGALGWFVYGGKGGSVGEKIKTFLPFGKGGEERVIPTTTENPNGGGVVVGEEGVSGVSILHKLHNSPIAGFYPFLRTQPGRQTATSTPDTIVRYIERGLGHIYETNMTSMKEDRISNETRLKIYEAMWGNRGGGVVIRYLSDDGENSIRTYSMTLRDIKDATSTEEGKRVVSQGIFLPENIGDLSVSHGKDDRMFYIFPSGDGSVGITSGFGGEKKTQLFESPLKEWLSQWPNDKLITLTTKPSQNIPGFMFFLDAQSGNVTKILSGINGLTTLASPDGKKILYAESDARGFGLYVYDVTNDTKTKLSLSTLPEKCVWDALKKDVLYCGVPQNIPQGNYPDGWYQGLVSFSDDIWMIDTKTNTTTIVASPTKIAGENIDVIKPLLSPDGSLLFFVNKKDSSPWSLKLTGAELQ